MTQEKVDTFMLTNSKYFLAEKLSMLRDRLLVTDESKLMTLQGLEYKDPTTMLLIQIFLGSIGVDRFMLGDTGMGVLKLLTCGLCGILTIIDWFSINKKTKEFNLNKIMAVI